MEALTDLSWRLYGAFHLTLLGAVLAARGTEKWPGGLIRALLGDSARLVTLMEVFRLSIIGLALAGLGAAWAWHIPGLLALSLVIGGGEILESSIDIFALRRWMHLELRRPLAMKASCQLNRSPLDPVSGASWAVLATSLGAAPSAQRTTPDG